MVLTPDPFEEFAYFQRRMNRLLRESLQGRPLLRRGGLTLEQPTWTPKVNIYRVHEKIVIYVELPGVSSPEEVKLEFKDNMISISGVRDLPDLGKEAHQLMAEGSFGPFQRLITLPENVDTSSITAKMISGVLEIHAPTRRSQGFHRVEIVEFE